MNYPIIPYFFNQKSILEMNYPIIPYFFNQKSIWELVESYKSPQKICEDVPPGKPHTVIVFARNWNIAKMMAMGGGWSTPPRIERDYEEEHNIHRDKRRKYRERCIKNIEKMPFCQKITLLLSEYDLIQLKPHFETNNIHILNSEPCLRSKKHRLSITIVKY
jgi:hypothetical protein